MEDLAGQSPEDAVAWFEWANFWHRAVRILSDYYLGPPPSLAELAARFRQEGEEELLETLLTVPLRELVERYFVSDEVKAAVAIGAFDMGDISAPGSAYITALYRFSAFREDTENYGIVRGGMGRNHPITRAIRRGIGRVYSDGNTSEAHPHQEWQGHRCRTRRRPKRR